MKKKERPVRSKCDICGHYPHTGEICGAIDAAGDECDCESYVADPRNPIAERPKLKPVKKKTCPTCHQEIK